MSEMMFFSSLLNLYTICGKLDVYFWLVWVWRRQTHRDSTKHRIRNRWSGWWRNCDDNDITHNTPWFMLPHILKQLNSSMKKADCVCLLGFCLLSYAKRIHTGCDHFQTEKIAYRFANTRHEEIYGFLF